MPAKPLPGRPKLSSKNRHELISSAATKLFAEVGYERTTIRLVAETAGVDPKLVMHYFGNKQKLFMATVRVPSEVSAALMLLKLTPRSSWGKRIADVIWLAQKGGAFQTLVGVIRASASEPEAAEMFKDFYYENLLLPMVNGLDVDNRELRAVMMSSIMAGYVFNLEVTRIFEKVASSEKKRKALFAKLIQDILTFELK